MAPLAEIERKQHLLREAVRGTRGLSLRLHDPGTSWLEAIMARGDRRLGPVIERAYERGARFDSWEDQLRLAEWQRALQQEGTDVDALLGPLHVRGRLPWDHFDVGLEQGFLEREYRKAMAGRLSPPCGKVRGMLTHHTDAAAARTDQQRLVCYDCGIACDLSQMRARRIEHLTNMERQFPESVARDREPSLERFPPGQYQPVQPGGAAVRWRLRYRKTGPASLLGHLDVARELPRIMRRAGVRTGYSHGFRPKPRMSFGPALALGILSLDEYLDVALVGAPAPERLVPLLNRASPEGLEFTGAVELAERDPGLCRILTSARYVAALSEYLLSVCGGSTALERRIVSFWQERHHRVVREGPRKIREVDVRAACESLELGQASDARLLVDAGLAGDFAPLGFNLSLSTGISARPVELLEALLQTPGPTCPVVRVGLLAGSVSPLDLSALRQQSSARRQAGARPDTARPAETERAPTHPPQGSSRPDAD
jgi:radical SAM-linked protein